MSMERVIYSGLGCVALEPVFPGVTEKSFLDRQAIRFAEKPENLTDPRYRRLQAGRALVDLLIGD